MSLYGQNGLGRGLPLLLHGVGGLGDGGPVLRGGGALQQRHFIPLAAFPGIRVIVNEGFGDGS